MRISIDRENAKETNTIIVPMAKLDEHGQHMTGETKGKNTSPSQEEEFIRFVVMGTIFSMKHSRPLVIET